MRRRVFVCTCVSYLVHKNCCLCASLCSLRVSCVYASMCIRRTSSSGADGGYHSGGTGHHLSGERWLLHLNDAHTASGRRGRDGDGVGRHVVLGGCNCAKRSEALCVVVVAVRVQRGR